ncbi:MgtC/SapB family protein [Clostridium botulinum]|uniref:Magnesium transporter MgtC n=1 Tax=Clostridium botulinum C/D str. DC5 TaxID=1443128 RepID=A0A0A0IE26_CLOBO|nr:MgtC/SapB family protein [Clostridium botulinum]KEI06811.1 magnesium transporter MgtC [Clostridium botulinum C/D str. BKT75002]KEI10921.1 magnesium transporter MgtC [Clostridium botulinum C/D str. BKT2873]KGM94730.1 magnesium transporter MgtC [Clostridium botulinum D str. CCUG 7971]KGM98581.1 magnesium transporter MgtC [Clostridium botulinum C/D str. DC5]KOC45976.1 magnesium transporter MgtC [Clostridium botulinum]
MSHYQILIRLGVAILIGVLLGYEREYSNRPAGLRTHILVCVGACVITMIQTSVGLEVGGKILNCPGLATAMKSDMGRLGAQVISGIGFLGAGTIIHEKGSVKGLTTAAGIWTTACIGLAVGFGYYFLSISAAIGVFIIIVCMKKVEVYFFDRTTPINIEIQYDMNVDLNAELVGYFKYKNIKIQNIIYIVEKKQDNKNYRKCVYKLLISKHSNLRRLKKELENNSWIIEAKVV